MKIRIRIGKSMRETLRGIVGQVLKKNLGIEIPASADPKAEK